MGITNWMQDDADDESDHNCTQHYEIIEENGYESETDHFDMTEDGIEADFFKIVTMECIECGEQVTGYDHTDVRRRTIEWDDEVSTDEYEEYGIKIPLNGIVQQFIDHPDDR